MYDRTIYVKVKGCWMYLYRAIDSDGNTLDFMLSEKRDARAAHRFFCKLDTGGEPGTGANVTNFDASG